MKTKASFLKCSLTLIALLAGAALWTATAAAQHTPCMAGEFLKSSCVPNTNARAGQTVDIPVAKICAKPTIMWLNVWCQPPGTCFTIRHSKWQGAACTTTGDVGAAGATDGTDTCPANAEPNVTQEFTNDDVITRIETLDQTASFLYRTAVSSDLSAEHDYEFEVTNSSAALQMIENPTEGPAEISGDVTFSEVLSLDLGESDRDLFINLPDSALVIENPTSNQVRLLVAVARSPETVLPGAADDAYELGAVVNGLTLSAGWQTQEPNLDSFYLSHDGAAARTANKDGFERGASIFRVNLEPGESWSRLIDSEEGELRLSVISLSRGETFLKKTLTATRNEVLQPGQKHYLLFAGAGQIRDTMTSPVAGLRNVVATAHYEEDVPADTLLEYASMGFDKVKIDALSVSGPILVHPWCWSTTPLDHWTQHYQAGSEVTIDTRISVPPSAVPGQTFTRWYTVNAVSGTMNQTIMCHTTVTVVP